ncbi:DUF4840 domain-containing protein [Myroides odoratimimus]|uniref:DUF4840 domain-containing protein n=2 Tax=Myroides odoratimimus TaxID=76832 RepID=UPI002576E277|nr:DUF4840 domain-containing protein [Myroides odoratimimus]MDM1086543.1 DUF4840 domain-containing protein [Myroides odoratimimus]
MKKSIKFKAILIVFSLIGLGLTSCSKDDDIIKPNKKVKVEDVYGSYSGKAITSQDKVKNEKNVNFSAKAGVISFTELPVKEIVSTVVGDSKKTEEALKALGKVKYNLDYKAALNKNSTAVELTFVPKALELKVPVDGKVKNVKVIFSAKDKGIYVSGKSNVVKFGFTVSELTIDEVLESRLVPINYAFPASVKK